MEKYIWKSKIKSLEDMTFSKIMELKKQYKNVYNYESKNT